MVLIITLLGVLLLSSIGAGLSMTTTTEVMVAAGVRRAGETRYAAESVVERALDDLSAEPNWDALASASSLSTFVNGAAAGQRTLPDGSTVDLDVVRNVANCGKAAACTSSEMHSVSSARPWGTRNPIWRLYAYGPLGQLAPASGLVHYGIVLLADDPASSVDTIWLRGQAFGPRGSMHTVEVAVTRENGEVRVLSWRDVRQSG